MKKGQTALEYLMTYGWAILIVIIVVAALYALGLTKPCRWTGTQIREFGNFRAREAKFTGAPNDQSTLEFSLAYLGPETVETADITAEVDGGACTGSATLTNLGSDAQAVTITGCPTKTAGDCYTAKVKITYNIVGGTITNLVSYGTISGVVA